MERYANRSGDSGVVAYEIGSSAIAVQFTNGAVYHYTNESAGANNIGQMKLLAKGGRGLGTFIKQHVNKLYASKTKPR